MDSPDDWTTVLNDHPIFSRPSGSTSHAWKDEEASLQLSTTSLPSFTNANPEVDNHSPSGRRQTMSIKDSELIVAVGKEIRVTALGDTKLGRSTRKAFKVLHTPNVQFEIHQLALNPSGKLLAVAGAFQVAVVVLPRPGFMKLVPTTIDCKSIQVGQYFHASSSSAPIAKVDWHPWGEAGSTLMIMTVDGKLREYDISVDTEEPLQVVSFVPERKPSKTFNAIDLADREVASFTLGKGKADWGPLTVYVVMKSGDVYAICPYMPKNASIPSSYIHALECFVAAKQEYLAQDSSAEAKALAMTYDYQHKYINALLKQLPPGTVFPATSRPILVHPPSTVKSPPLRQGPFLLQPSPCVLEGSEGGDATDLMYLAFGNDLDEDEAETERLGLLLIASQDGRVDICLDVDKVEAQWDSRHHTKSELPMLAVYETVDLGLINMLSTPQPSLVNLLEGSHPVFLADPIHDDTVYVYHAFGAHVLHMDRVLRSLSAALRADHDGPNNSLATSLAAPVHTDVRPIVSTFSIETKASNPIIAVAVPNDVYLTYSIFILTSAMRVVSYALDVGNETAKPATTDTAFNAEDADAGQYLHPAEGPTAYVSSLGTTPFEFPEIFERPASARIMLSDPQASRELQVSPDTLRFLGKTVEQFIDRIHEVYSAYGHVQTRQELQKLEYARQTAKLQEMQALIEQLKGPRQRRTEEKVEKIKAGQTQLLARLDRVLQELTKKANPELSDHETKWFDELKRMRAEVSGAGRYDEESLKARAHALQREYSRLLPQLKALKEKEVARQKNMQDVNQGLGVSQAFEFGQQFNRERTRIQKIQKDILGLATDLELSLSRPPPLREA